MAERRSVFERLEGSRCGIFELYILNPGKNGESWRSGQCIADGRFDQLSGRLFPEFHSSTAGKSDGHEVHPHGIL
jgi:hypothetical protein